MTEFGPRSIRTRAREAFYSTNEYKYNIPIGSIIVPFCAL